MNLIAYGRECNTKMRTAAQNNMGPEIPVLNEMKNGRADIQKCPFRNKEVAMYDLYTVEVFIRERQQSILDEVTRNRMSKKARPAGPGIGERLSARTGDILIGLGNRLKRGCDVRREENTIPVRSGACR